MISKLLFTFGLLAVVYLAIRARLTQGRHVTPPATASRVEAKPEKNEARLAAWMLIGVMVAVTVTFLYFEWQEAYRVVDVRVIDVRSGRTVTYQAHRRDVGDRSFETVDGRFVTLAEVERMEIGGAE